MTEDTTRRRTRPGSGHYVVLWRGDVMPGWQVTTDDDGEPILWAGDATKAVRAAAHAHPDLSNAVRAGSCQVVAVPAASWRPVTTHMEQPPPVLRIAGADGASSDDPTTTDPMEVTP